MCYRQGFCLPVSPTNAPGNQDPVEKAIFKYQYPALGLSYKPIYILMLKYYTSFFSILLMLAQIGSKLNSSVINSYYSMFTPFMAHWAYRMQ